MELVILSFLAGVLTVLSPCVLPILPVVVAGSTESKDKKAPYVIIASLLASVFVFTLLLKGTTAFIDISDDVWFVISGVIVTVVGLSFLFPAMWEKLAQKLRITTLGNTISTSASHSKHPLKKQLLLGLSLGPIFTSCSPTYGIILATILPVSFLQGFVYLLFYVLGLSFVLLLLAVGGQNAAKKLQFASDPSGKFRKIVAIILITTGLLIATGVMKRAETWLVDNGYLGLSSVEDRFTDSFTDENNSTAPNSDVAIPDHLKRAFPSTDWSQASPEISEVVSGGPGKDGIPAIDNPKFIPLDQAPEQNDVLAIVLDDGDTKKVYPYSILTWHEIVNDTANNTPVAVTFCPLCGSAIVFERVLPDGSETTFGVSGSLLESNMIMYDRNSESLWQQSTGKALAGSYHNKELNLVSFQLITMGEVREKYSQAQVLSRETGHSRDYERNPYSGYEESEDFYFAPSVQDNRYPSKDIFVAFKIDETPVAVPLKSLADNESYQTIVAGNDITIRKTDEEVFISTQDDDQIPFYFEMWFSWATQHQQNGTVFDPAKQ